MRFLGVDFGLRRLGLAVSDASATLARPWKTIAAGATPRASAEHVAALVEELRRDPDRDLADVAGVVVGLPRRLGGEDTHGTAPARAFAAALEALIRVPIHLQDERLTSHEADQLLAERERDWRRRKEKLDAAAAAILLQDFLDARARAGVAGSGPRVDPPC